MSDYDWLENLLEDVEAAESPTRYKFWSALYTIGAVTKRKIYLNMKGIYNIYPSMYILLVGDSGIGKNFPVIMARNLLKESGVCRVIYGRNSIEAVIETLGKMTTLESGTIIKNAEAALISPEFSNMLISNPDALTIMTELWDCSDEWTNSLRKGRDVLRNIFVSMLGATNMEQFNDKIQEKDLKGGFISRTICINETEVSKLNSLLDNSEDVVIDYVKHAQRLIAISKLSGQMHPDESFAEVYNEWYYPFHQRNYNDKTGFVKRVKTHILKTAMCLSLTERDDLILTDKHAKDAMALVLPMIDSNVEVSRMSGKSKYRSQIALITTELIQAPHYVVTRRQILRNHTGEMTAKDLSDIVGTLIQGGIIESVRVNNEEGYKLTDRSIKDLKGKRKGGI